MQISVSAMVDRKYRFCLEKCQVEGERYVAGLITGINNRVLCTITHSCDNKQFNFK